MEVEIHSVDEIHVQKSVEPKVKVGLGPDQYVQFPVIEISTEVARRNVSGITKQCNCRSTME